MKWKTPPLMKVYEALGVLADGRIHVTGKPNIAAGARAVAEVDSSQLNKVYKVIYDSARNTIVASDSGSFWQRYVSYPSIALLLELGVIKYDKSLIADLKGIAWKDMADKYKHDYAKMEEETLTHSKYPAELKKDCERILAEVMNLDLDQPEHLLRPTK